MASHAAKKTTKRHPVARAAGILLLIAALVVVAAFVGGNYYFKDHFVPGTTINGQDASWHSDGDIAKQADEDGKSWKTSVSGDGLSLELDASSIDLSYDGNALAKAARSEAAKTSWYEQLIHPKTIRVAQGVNYDKDKLKNVVDTAVKKANKNAKAPVDATITYDKDKDAFVVKEASEGTKLDEAKTLATIANSLRAAQTDTKLDTKDLVQPAVASDDAKLQLSCKKANTRLDDAFQITSGGKALAEVDRATIASWTSANRDGVTTDTTKVAEWLRNQKALSVRTESGNKISQTDYASLQKAVLDNLDNDSSKAIELPLTTTNKQQSQASGSVKPLRQGRYIDVNLKTQYARLFDSDGKVIWESYIVSGDTVKKCDTPCGTFSINAKMRDQKLVGEDTNGDGEPDYQSHVDYWMPFVGNSVGLHDATWRSYFGGSIYRGNGSHGCVNLPHDKAATLYQLIKVGDVVVVHNG